MATEIHKKALKELASFDENKPVFMMNYLKYKSIVTATGKTGKETYTAYLKATVPFFNQIDAEIILKVKKTFLLQLSETTTCPHLKLNLFSYQHPRLAPASPNKYRV